MTKRAWGVGMEPDEEEALNFEQIMIEENEKVR